MELAREVVPSAKKVGLLTNLHDPKAAPQLPELEAAGSTLGVETVPSDANTPEEIEGALAMLASARVDVVAVLQSSMLIGNSRQIAASALAKRLPTVYGYREHVEAGGLVSYGVNLDWCNHRVAYYVDRILKGAKPSDLPIEFPTEIEMVLNLKTAKALGLQISPMLLTRAHEVIE